MSDLVFVKRTSGNQWTVGMPDVSIGGLNKKSMKSFDVTKTVDSTPMKDADGITRAVVYADVLSNGSCTFVHESSSKPEPKETFTYEGVEFVILSVGESYNADGKWAMTNVTFEGYEGCQSSSSQ